MGAAKQWIEETKFLKQKKDRILRVWEERARESNPVAKQASGPVLLNALAPLLDNLAESLTVGGKSQDLLGATVLGREHGAQRAEQGNYTISQVLHEMHILRQVIFEVLEEGHPPVSSATHRHILDSIDESILVPLDDVPGFRTLFGLHHFSGEKVRHSQYDAERSSQLVAHIGDEFALRFVSRAQELGGGQKRGAKDLDFTDRGGGMSGVRPCARAAAPSAPD
jgi:hypothetical protein